MNKYIPLLLLLIGVILALVFGLQDYLSFDFLKKNQEKILSFIKENLAFSVLLYTGLYVIVVALSIPGATFMTLIGGLFFGQYLGTLLVVTAATLGATILFLSIKFASEKWINKKSQNWIQKMKEGFQKNAHYYLLTLRLIPLFPFVAVNLVAAILQIRLRTFIVGTFLGIIPGSFIYVSLGSGLSDILQKETIGINFILEPKMIFGLCGLGILSLLPVLYNYIKQKNH